MAIEQFRIGSNSSYLIYCKVQKVGALVDPGSDAAKALEFIENNNIKLLYVINTHHHSDHVADNSRVKDIHGCLVIASEPDSKRIGNVDRTVHDGEEIELGNITIRFLLTPGHTPGSICIVVNDEAIITGDTLFTGDCGRTDFPGGSDSRMFETLQMFKSLPDSLVVYPGHDYGGKPFDTLGNQKLTNKTMLATTLEDFKLIP